MRIELRADRAAQRLDRLHDIEPAECRSGDEIGMAADILGERIDGDIGTLVQRTLEYRAEQGVVADDHRAMLLLLVDFIRDARDERDVDQRIQRIGRRLDEDDRDTALFERVFGRAAHRRFTYPIREARSADAEIEEGSGQQRFGAAIERLRMQDGIAGAGESQKRRGDRRHAGGEERANFGLFEDGEPVLDDFAVRVVEARIDEAGACAFRRLAPTGNEIEEILALLGGLEDESRGEEDGWLDGTFRELRIEAVAQHKRFGMEAVIADMSFVWPRLGHCALCVDLWIFSLDQPGGQPKCRQVSLSYLTL